MSSIQLIIGDASLDLDRLTSSKGNEYYGLTNANGKFAGFGEPKPALSTVLPDEVRLVQGGRTLATLRLTHGVTEDGRAKVTATNVPVQCDLGDKVATVSISVTKSGDWNVKASVNGKGGGTGGARKITSGWNTVTVSKVA